MSTVGTDSSQAVSPRRFKFAEAVVTDVGRRRNENQDAYSIAHTETASLYVVADGMGGARGGATASAIAVHVITERAISAEGSVTPSSLKSAIELSNKVIYAKSKQDEELAGMGTTVVVLALVEDKAFIAHVGDSRIYLWRNGELKQLTRDHTLVQELVDTGAIPPEEAANHPIAHMLTRSLGPTEAVEVELGSVPEPIEARDKFLLCSDGLYNLVSDEEMAEALAEKDPQSAADHLVNLALERGGTDNVTIEVLEAMQLSDPALESSYPRNGTVDLKVSRNVESSSLETIIADVLSSEGAGSPDAEDGLENGTKKGRTGSSRRRKSEAGDPLEDTLKLNALESDEEAFDDLDVTYEDTANRELLKMQLGVAVVLLVVLLLVGYSLYQYGALRRMTILPTPTKRIEQTVDRALARQSQDRLQPREPVHERDELARELDDAADEALHAALPAASLPNEAVPNEAVPNEAAVQSESPEPARVEHDIASPVAGPDESAEPPAPEPESASSAEPPVERQLPDIGVPVEGGIDIAKGVGPAPAEDAAQEPAEVTEPTQQQAEAVLGLEEVEQVREEVNRLEVPPPPEVKIKDEEVLSIPANQPIVWENEEDKITELRDERALAEPTPAAPVELAKADTASTGTVLSEKEQLRISRQKAELRERIADVDVKLSMLTLTTKDQVDAKVKEMNGELEKLVAAVELTRSEVQGARERISLWQAITESGKRSGAAAVLEEAALLSDRIAVDLKALRQTQEEYTNALAEYRANPQRLELASRIGALGREVKRKEAAIADVLDEEAAGGIAKAEQEIAAAAVTLENLERRRSQLNRHIGYYQGFTPLNAGRKRELKGTYLEERDSMLKELEALRAKLSDERESTLRGNPSSPS